VSILVLYNILYDGRYDYVVGGTKSSLTEKFQLSDM